MKFNLPRNLGYDRICAHCKSIFEGYPGDKLFFLHVMDVEIIVDLQNSSLIHVTVTLDGILSEGLPLKVSFVLCQPELGWIIDPRYTISFNHPCIGNLIRFRRNSFSTFQLIPEKSTNPVDVESFANSLVPLIRT